MIVVALRQASDAAGRQEFLLVPHVLQDARELLLVDD